MTSREGRVIVVNWKVFRAFIAALFKLLRWPLTAIITTYLVVHSLDKNQNFTFDWDLLLRYINVLIWPLVVIWALRFIKPNLPNLLDRLEELSVFGNNARFTAIQKQDTETKASELSEVDKNASKASSNVNSNIYQIADDETHALLTSTEAAVAYMQIYVDIFGTQVELLRRLVDYPNGLRAEEFGDLLEKHKRLSGSKGFTDIFPYLQFLLSNTLILHNSTSQTYQLTNAGYYFLAYLAKEGYLDRPKSW